MRILLAPYAQKLRCGNTNAKNYQFFPELLNNFRNHEIIQVGVKGEVPLVTDFREGLPYKQLLALTASVDFFISVDSVLPHLAKHVNKTGAVIWGKSDPLIFGYPENLNILKDRKYLRKDQFKYWEEEPFDDEVWLGPAAVYQLIKKRFLNGVSI